MTNDDELHGIRAFGTWVIVTPSPQDEEKQPSGLIVPQHAAERPGRGLVVSVGAAVENFGEPPKPGDVVFYNHHHHIDNAHHAVEANMIYGIVPA